MKTGILLGGLILFNSTALFSQNVQMKVLSSDGQNVMLLRELFAILVSENDTVKVQHMPDKGHLPEAYRDVNLKTGDAVLMVNKKRVRSSAELESIYEDVKVGDEVKLGIEREGQFMFASFKKGDPDELAPNGNVFIRRESGDGGPVVEDETIDLSGSPDKAVVMSTTGEVEVLAGTNLILNQREGKIYVMDVLPGATELTRVEAKAGDEIIAMNGKKVTSLPDLMKVWQGIGIGKEVTLKYLRDGKENEAKFKKPEPKGTFIFKD